MDSIPILSENKNECYAMQTRSQLKNLRNISMDKNEDYMKNKLLWNVEVTNKVQKKRGRPRKIIEEIKLQEQIKRRGRPRKVINKSPENDKKRKFAESEDESDSDPDYDIKQKPKANKKRNIIECRDQLTMRKDNYAYFVNSKGEPRDVGSKLLKKCGSRSRWKLDIANALINNKTDTTILRPFRRQMKSGHSKRRNPHFWNFTRRHRNVSISTPRDTDFWFPNRK